MKRLALLLCLALAAGAACAADIKMHRKQAGELDKSGWTLAASTEGRFSVRLPLKFNDFTVVDSDPNAAAARTFTVGARSSERIAFVATRIVYRKGAESAKLYYSRFEKGQDLPAKPDSITQRKVGSIPAVDVVLRKGDDLMYQRVVLLGADLLMLTVETPKEHQASVQQLVPVFFDSLQVEAM